VPQLVSPRGKSIGDLQRSRWDIVDDILSLAVVGETKTHIMYKCNLSFGQVKNYLNFLVDNGLLKVGQREDNSEVKCFFTTDKGRIFLRAYNSLKDTLRDKRLEPDARNLSLSGAHVKHNFES